MKNIKYKMYKDGKFLVFAGLIFIGAVTGATLDNTHYASADSTDLQADGNNGQDILANQKSVILDSQKSTDTQQADSQKSTDTQQADSQKSTDTQQADSQKSTDTQQNLSERIGDVVSTYVGKEQFNHISRDVHFRATTGENGADSVDIPDNLLPSDVNSFVNYYRYPVYDNNNQLVGYSSDGQQNDISLDDANQGWRVRGQATQLPDVDVPDLSAEGFDVNTNKVTSNYNVQQGFTDSLDGNVDKIRNNYYTADGSSQIVSNPTNNLNSYEHVTITYHYVRTKEYNTSNFYRQIDYVNKNENDGVQAGSHIADTRFDAINYRQIKVFQKGKFLGYSTTNNSLNVDLPADDSNQGWRLYANPNNEEQYLWNWNNGVSPESIPDVQSPVISGYGSPSISTVISNYQIGAPTAEGTGFTNKNGDPNVWISGQTGFPNTFEYVKVVYPSANNKVVSQTKTITRVINYLDRSAYDLNGRKVVDDAKVAQTVTQTVTFKRDAVYSADGDLLGYTSGKYGDKTPDISIQGGDRAWQLDDTDIWAQVDSPDLSSKGYSSPDRSSINQYAVKSTDEDVIENVFYSKQSITVGPKNPKVPGTPINPDNPNGPKWPAGTDVDSLSRSVTRTIKYIDSDTGKEVSKYVTETVNYYRTAVVDKVTGALLGYSTDETDTVTLTPDQADRAWLTDNNKWAEVMSPDLTDKGYSTPDRAKIDEIIVPFNGQDAQEVVKYNHKVDTVTPENPGIPGQPINPDNPNGPKWPNGTDKNSLSKTINQTINYVDGNGKIVHDPSHDQVTFSRTATVDEVTGQVTYTDWNNASETFSPKVSPVIPGYVLRDDSQKTISGITVNPSSSDNNETVIYDKVGSLVPVDTTGNPIDSGSHNTSYPNDPNDAGKVTNPIIPSIPGKTPIDKNGNPLTPGNNYPIDGFKPTEDTKLTYVDSNQKAKVSYVDSTTGKTLESVDLSGQPQSTSNYRTTDTIKKYTDQGYQLVNDNYPASGVKFNSDDKKQDFTVTLGHKVDTVTPENLGIPGQPINPDNPNGPKWPNGTDKNSLSKTINQTINYV
ncbi:mucin-binding protein, partial [Fructobacillus fructosus]|uniref:mucin-binding protein n=1 Tax=Fructobacillus fructosus TaxID=1631 RepID=UPI0030C823F0